MAEWTNLLQRPNEIQQKQLSDYFQPRQGEMALQAGYYAINAASAIDENRMRGIRTRILERQNELEEKSGDFQRELLPYIGVEIPGQPMIPTSMGMVAKSTFDQAAKNNPTGGRQETQEVYKNMMALATERRKAAETYRNDLVKAGWGVDEIDNEVARLYPDAMASVRQGGPMPTAPGGGAAPVNQYLAPQAQAPPPQAAPMPSLNLPTGGAAAPMPAPTAGGPAPVPMPNTQVPPQTPQAAPQAAPTGAGQPLPAQHTRAQFLDAVSQAQMNADPEAGLAMLGSIKPSSNWEKQELKDARMFMATRGAKPTSGTEATYLRGLEDQMRQAHKDWPETKVKFEAAKQVRAENLAAAKQKVEFSVNMQQGGAEDSFTKWTPAQKDTWFQMTETDRQSRPNFGFRDIKSRRDYDREFAQYLIDKKQTGRDTVVGQREFKADASALQKLTEIEQRVESYNIRINETSNKVLIPLIKKWDLQNPRFVNWTVNQLQQVMGSGDLASLKLALNSVSNEVGKVEYNALGIQQLSDSASKFMASVHDPNMPVSELLKVVDTSRALGKTGKDALNTQREALKNRMKKPTGSAPAEQAAPAPAAPSGATPQKVGRFTIEVVQ